MTQKYIIEIGIESDLDSNSLSSKIHKLERFGTFMIKYSKVKKIDQFDNDLILNTLSPHINSTPEPEIKS